MPGEYGIQNVRPGWVDEEPTGYVLAESLAAIDIEVLGAMSISEHEEGACSFCDMVRAEVVRRLEEDEDEDDDDGGGGRWSFGIRRPGPRRVR